VRVRAVQLCFVLEGSDGADNAIAAAATCGVPVAVLRRADDPCDLVQLVRVCWTQRTLPPVHTAAALLSGAPPHAQNSHPPAISLSLSPRYTTRLLRYYGYYAPIRLLRYYGYYAPIRLRAH
jgi:hypothetical protein